MERNGLGLMGSSLGGAALGIVPLAQGPSPRPLGIPMWGYILLFALVIIVAVIWVLREEGQEAAPASEEPEPLSEPETTRTTSVVEEASAPAPEPDDLQRIEGIGPKIAGLLQAAGVSTFSQLAQADVDRLKGILAEAGIGRIADPGTWPEQAKLAAAGDWEGLEDLQDRLKGGRQVES
jgi:predicted flap endonuclease-1-like 5' DNA nuclease